MGGSSAALLGEDGIEHRHDNALLGARPLLNTLNSSNSLSSREADWDRFLPGDCPGNDGAVLPLFCDEQWNSIGVGADRA
jgi:hypothetical protein